MESPRLSIVLLTLNEERHIGACLRSLARQRRTDFEVIVVDAASSDATAEIVRRAQSHFPVPLRLSVARRRVPIGEARNHGVRAAHAPIVAFVSADAELHPHWIDEALRSLGAYDIVYGQQLHQPQEWTLAAAVRGLRYHYPPEESTHALPYASNVAAAYRKDVLVALPFDPWANAAEDVLLARRAEACGYRAVYNPRMIVRHHDATTPGQAMRKSLREGNGWGTYADELGLFMPVLAWGTSLAIALFLLALLPSLATLLLAATVVWMPALRRALLRRHAMPLTQLVKGALASPPFDLVFLASYLHGLAGRHRPPSAAKGASA